MEASRKRKASDKMPAAAKSGHLIDFAGRERLPEQIDRPAVEGMDAEQVAAVQEL